MHPILPSLPLAVTIAIAFTITITTATTFPAHTDQEPNLPQLLEQAARFQSGQSTEPLRRLEQLAAQSATEPTLRAQLEVGLIQLLSPAATFEARKFACELLAVIGSESAVPALAALLDNPDTVTIACFALTPNPSPRAGEALRHALASTSGHARLQIIHALGNRRDREAVPLLAELSRAPDLVTAETAIIALGKIADPQARASLDALRNEAGPQRIPIVEEAILKTAEQLVIAGNIRQARRIYENLLTSASALHIRRGALDALFQLDRDQGQRRILDTLRGAETALKPVAIAAIPSLPGSRVSQRFGRELVGLAPHEQVLLLEAIAARTDPGATDVIRAQLTSEHEPVRLAAIRALGQSSDPTMVPALTRALANAATQTERVAIERTLTALPENQAIDRAILSALPTAPTAAKPHLMSTLAQRRSRVAIPALLEETASPTPAVARAAFQALGRLATEADLPALLDRLAALQSPAARPDAETTVARALDQVDPVGRRWEILRDHLGRSEDLETRLSLLRLAPNAPAPIALAAVESALHDPNPEVADTALRALAEWPDIAAWNALARLYRGDVTEPHRVLALRGLVRMARDAAPHPDDILIQRYRQLFDGVQRDDDRKLILGALAATPHPDALSLAVAQLEYPGARAEAELAVRRIAEAIQKQHPEAAQTALDRL